MKSFPPLALGTVLGLLAALPHPCPAAAAAAAAKSVPDDWAEATAILARIQAPQFPARNFPITDFGATAGADATAALRTAIERCHAAGGGHVVVPAGVFLTGAIHLLSNVDLHLDAGATLRFSPDPKAYLPVVATRWEGTECMNYSPFIYAYEQQNIGLTGAGTLDGGATIDNWWGWAKRGDGQPSRALPDARELNRQADAGLAPAQRLFGEGHFLRPNFIQPNRCTNVIIEGVTIVQSPMWEINPVLCTNVTVRNVAISSHGPNNDGCDPECSRDVLIEGCTFDTGDDCIAIKSGRNDDGRRVGRPSENLVIRRCNMKDGHGGVVIGSEISGGCRNVFVEDCQMDSPHLKRALRFKSNARRGGVVENVFLRHVTIGEVAESIITVDFLYEEGAKGAFPPTVRHVFLENVTARHTPRVFYLAGFAGATIDDLHLSHCEFSGVTSTDVIDHAGKITLDQVSVLPARRPGSLSSRGQDASTAAP